MPVTSNSANNLAIHIVAVQTGCRGRWRSEKEGAVEAVGERALADGSALLVVPALELDAQTPGDSGHGLPVEAVGARTHLPSIARAVAAARKAGAPGVLPDLIAQFQGTAAAWEKLNFTGAQIES